MSGMAPGTAAEVAVCTVGPPGKENLLQLGSESVPKARTLSAVITLLLLISCKRETSSCAPLKAWLYS